MRTARQEYRDATYEDALKAGCDTVQLKYDGWWTRIEIVNGEGRVFSRTNRPLTDFDFTIPTGLSATIVGELMFGTNWSQQEGLRGLTYAFDIWSLNGEDLEAFPYKKRYVILGTTMPLLPSTFRRVFSYRIQDREIVWNRFVLGAGFEGVVYRRSTDGAGAVLLREKRLITDEYMCLGVYEGEGKHAGRAGGIIVGDRYGTPLYTSDGNRACVGGGFNDAEREKLFKDPCKYIGRRFEVEGKARFPDSGLLRHPNFVKWSET